MGAMSRRKGRTGEQELSRYLSARGFPARRSRQYKGHAEAPDIHCPSIPFALECKRTEKLSLYPVMEKAEADADGPALVVHRRNNRPWLAVLRLDDLLALLEAKP